MTQQTFNGLGIAPKIREILDKLHFTVPTPIQNQSIQPALLGKDIMGIAQTGTGKTLAFGIPMMQLIAQNKGKGLVILPTRELAAQVREALNQVGQHLGLRMATLIGGENIHRQLVQLRVQPHIVIATPGRLIDHIKQRTVNLSQTKILVLDEADRMLDMGFAPQIKEILKTLPKDRQTLLFSATLPVEIVSIAKNYMKFPVRVEVAPSGTAAANVTQEIFFVNREDKLSLLKNILSEYKGSVLIFSRTKFGVKKMTQLISRMGHTVSEIHSNRSLNQRTEALAGFKTGRYRILAATDIAARGLDVNNIELVINYDLPEQISDYVHRIGRTGRASNIGHAISFATPNQKSDVKAIEKLIKKQLVISNLPSLPKNQFKPSFNKQPKSSENSYLSRKNVLGRSGSRRKKYGKDNADRRRQPFSRFNNRRGKSRY